MYQFGWWSSDFHGIFKDIPHPCMGNYFNMDKKFTHQRKHSFFYSKRSWIDRYSWEKYLIDNS